MLVAQLARLGQIGRRVEMKTTSRLHERLAHKGGDLVPVLAQCRGQQGQRLVDRATDLAAPIAHALGRRHEMLARQVAGEEMMHALLGIAEAHHAGGVAVVAVA
jgi:hypothetical protein